MAWYTSSAKVGVWALALAMVVPSLVWAQDANRPQPHMQKMRDAFGTLRTQIADAAKKEDNLKLLQEFEAAVLAAKDSVPPMIAAMPEAERPARIAEYKKTIVKLMRQALDAEDAVLAGDAAKAQEAITAMAATQTEGHRGFRPARGGGGGGGRRGGGGAGGAPGGAPAPAPAQ